METRNTQPASNVANPQDVGTSNGASNAEDFQSTAPSEALRNEVDNLTVQETGEPATGTTRQTTGNDMPIGWIITVGFIVVIAIYVLVKLIKEAVEDNKTTPRSTVSAAAPAAKTIKKKPVKKTAAKKKSAPNQRKKKPAAKKKRS